MRAAAVCLLALLAAASALAAGGAAPFGRLALFLGLNGPAADLLDDPLWRGVALHRAGAFDAAAESFRQAGPRASFNRGNALAFTGRYDEAVAAYEAVIFRDPTDEEAHANLALIAPLASLVRGEDRSGGRTEAAAGVDEAPDAGRAPEPAEAPRTLSHEEIKDMMRELYKTERQAAQSIVASRQWLATLPDEPGRYLKLRLAAEQRQRIAEGRAAAGAADDW